MVDWNETGFSIPIGSMYGIYANIWGILMVNVTIYGIHGSYGICDDNVMPRNSRRNVEECLHPPSCGLRLRLRSLFCFFFFPPILFTISESNTSLEMHPRWWILVNCPFCTSVNGRPRALLLGNLPYLPDVLVLDVAFMDFKASLVWLVTQSHDIPIESRKNKRAYYQVPLWTMVKSRYKLLIILHGSPLINQYQQKYYGTSLNYGNYGYG